MAIFPSKRYVADPSDQLQIVRETKDTIVLYVQARDNDRGCTVQFEFDLNGSQLKSLLTFGATPR